MKSTVVTST